MSNKIEKQAEVKNPNALRTVRPVVDIYENDANCKVLVDLPGVTSDAVQLSLEQDTLTLSAERTLGVPEAVVYERAFSLPSGIETDKISADLNAGVLTLTLPKHESTRPRRIAVNAA